MAEQACADIGMSWSTAINIYLKNLGVKSEYLLRWLQSPFIRRKI